MDQSDSYKAISEENSNVLVFKKTEATKKISIVQDDKYQDLAEDELLNYAIEKLPKAYNFEIYKSILRIRELNESLKRRSKVALQMPDGFMLFSVLIADILETFANCETVILGDITYGACCIDDLGSRALECDFIIHYGHSCLIPVTETCVKSMYVFVDIQIDVENLIKTIELNFTDKEQIIYLMGSIQYNNSVFLSKKKLVELGFKNVIIPQTKPRSNGEVLGCTSPKITIEKKEGQQDPIIIFICDGRFHMESAMIANPEFTFYQYNPFLKILSLEKYDVDLMKKIRQDMIRRCRDCNTVGIIFGILGRQGNPEILTNITGLLVERKIKYYIIMLSEITEEKLNEYQDCECFIQIACPRISIDWGSYFSKAVITPYEAFVNWNKTDWRENYPMDYYSYEGGEWSNYYNKRKNMQNKKQTIQL